MEISKELREKAAKIAKQLGVKVMYANEKGELFTVLNLAMLSVDNDREKIATLNFGAMVVKDPEIPHTVTEEDLELNPGLAQEGIKAGDEITIPQQETASVAKKNSGKTGKVSKK